MRLRVKDIDFAMNSLTIFDCKGRKDRVVMLPERVKPFLKELILQVESIHRYDLSRGCGEVYLPFALAKKYPNSSKLIGWQYVFPAGAAGS